MSNPNPKLRTALGISALSAFSLMMVGCGGSSSSAPAVPANQAPGNIIIAGSTTAVTNHATIYNLSAVDPEGDAITFSTTTAGATISGSVLTFTPTAVATPATLSVVATDSKGAASAAKTFAVNVTANKAPVFTSTTPATAKVGVPVSYTVVTTDDENDTVTLTKLSGPGTLAGNVLTYTPALAEIGNQSFSLKADDGKGGTTTQNFTIVVGPSGAPLFTSAAPTSVKVGKSVNYTITTSDPEGNPVTLSKVSGPGTLTGNVLTYTPAIGDLNSTKSFSIKADDGFGGVSTQTFNLDVVPSGAPIFTSIAPIGQVRVGQTVTYSVVTTDPEGDAVTLTKVSGLGTLSGGVFTYTPALAQINTNQSFQLKADDGNGGVSVQNFSLDVAPSQAPIFTSVAPTTVRGGYSLPNYTLTATDPEGNPIAFSVDPLTPLPTGASLVGSLFSYTPVKADEGLTKTFRFKSDDGLGGISYQSVSINVVPNRAPAIVSQPTGAFTPAAVTPAINFNTFQVQAQDPDNDTVVFALDGSFTPTFVSNLGGAVAGCAVSVNPTTGIVTFTGNVPAGATSVKATFKVKATDQLPTSTFNLTSPSQQIELTYNSGNVAPVITTSSLPSLPANHFIPISLAQANTGFPMIASDANPGDDAQLKWTIQPGTTTGLVLKGAVAGVYTGPNATLVTDGTFNNATTAGAALAVNVRVTDPGGLSNDKSLSISIVGDQQPTLNSNVYTETVSGVVAFDTSQVKWQITGGTGVGTLPLLIQNRTRFYPGPLTWIGQSPYGTYSAGETADPVGDSQATNLAFSNVLNLNQWNTSTSLITLLSDNLPTAGWNARTLFRDPEGDGILYDGGNGTGSTTTPNNGVVPGSVFVSSPLFPVGQTFTRTEQGNSSNTFPIILGKSPRSVEYPVVDKTTGTLRWLPVFIEDPTVLGSLSNLGQDAFNQYIFTNPSIWSFTVQAYEQVYLPHTGAFQTITSNKGNQNYTVKVQPNNRPWVGALYTIQGGNFETYTSNHGMNDGRISNVTIGGGTNANTLPGRPSIQEPESKRYDTAAVVNFPYDAANSTTAKWRWLFARAGGYNNLPTYTRDVEMYDPDRTTVTGHQDTVHASTLNVGVTIGTWNAGNWPGGAAAWPLPAVTPGSALIYNPWEMSSDAGMFEINWGPSRMQYMLSRMAGFQTITLPVNVRDQYERQNATGPVVYPIFGTIRIANARDRVLYDVWGDDTRRRGTFLTTANENDAAAGSSASGPHYTFSYLPIVGFNAPSETNVTDGLPSTHLFDGPTYGQTDGAIYVMPQSGTDSSNGCGNFLSTSWITLFSKDDGERFFHNTNPLNDQSAFNKDIYAAGLNGGNTNSVDWRTMSWDVANQRPVADTQRADFGGHVDHEARAHVIPSNSPYMFTVKNGSTKQWGGHWISGYFGNYPTETSGNVIMESRRGWVNSGNQEENTGWYVGQRQSEIDYSRAIAGRPGSTTDDSLATTNGMLRWTYTWPTLRSNSTVGRATGAANRYELEDILQIAVPNLGGNGRFFFTGNGNPQGVNSFGRHGMSGSDTLTTPVGAMDSTNILGTNADVWTAGGFTSATTAAFHAVTDSIWVPNNAQNVFNVPNATTFTAGVNYTQLPWVGIKGFLDDSVLPGMSDRNMEYFEDYSGVENWNANPSLLDLNSGDRVFFTWLKKDGATESWGTFGAAMMSEGATFATGTFTTLPAFTMGAFLTDTFSQISFATGSLPGVNQAGNAGVGRGDTTTSFASWQRSQWSQLAPAMGPQATNPAINYGYAVLPYPKTRLVNPQTNVTTSTDFFGNVANGFNAIGATVPSTEGGVRDSLVIYGVRDRSVDGGANFGAAGIEPGSPVLAQWANTNRGGDIGLNFAQVDSSTLGDISSFPTTLTNFYSPFRTDIPGFKEVAQLKMNFVVGQQYPGVVAGGRVNKVPATVEQTFAIHNGPVVDPTNTNVDQIVDMGRPVLGPVRLARLLDYKANYTGTDRFRTVIDLVNSDPSDPFNGTGMKSLLTLPLDLANVFSVGSYGLSGDNLLNGMSTMTLAFQSSVNNQVIPSGYIVELYYYGGGSNPTGQMQPRLNHTFRMGHIGGQSQVQVMHLPALRTFSVTTSQTTWYFFKIRSFWAQDGNGTRIDMEKEPTRMGIPYALADFVSAPFAVEGTPYFAP